MNWSCAVGFDVRERERRYGIVHIASTFSVLQERKKKKKERMQKTLQVLYESTKTRVLIVLSILLSLARVCYIVCCS